MDYLLVLAVALGAFCLVSWAFLGDIERFFKQRRLQTRMKHSRKMRNIRKGL